MLSGWEEGVTLEHCAGARTARQLADGGVSIPPRSAILVAEDARMMQ